MFAPTYPTEKDLQLFLANLDLTLPKNYEKVVAKREQPVGGCIPDLIYVAFYTFPPRCLLPAKWSYQHTFILSQLRRHATLSLSALARRAFDQPCRLAGLVNDLVDSGAAVKSVEGALQLSDSISQMKADIIAVEVKLKRWREALDQATKYAEFADEVIVAMDATGIPSRDAYLSRFEDKGIGLLSVHNSQVSWVLQPKRQDPTAGCVREYLVAAAYDSRRQSPWNVL